MKPSLSHLVWIPAGAVTGFAVSFVFGDVLTLPLDVYYLLYFVLITGFLAIYVSRTGLDLRTWLTRRTGWGLAAGFAVGLLMMRNVLSRPETLHFADAILWWEIFWRGIVYGAVDGILLFGFPWIVTWRAFDAETKGLGAKIGAALAAWVGILLVTTTYHLGYRDFRSQKIVQPNIGSTITSVATLATANPVASPLSHVFLHVTAVVHSPESPLFLPPHREEEAMP